MDEEVTDVESDEGDKGEDDDMGSPSRAKPSTT